MLNAGMLSSKTPEWATPQDFFDELNKEYFDKMNERFEKECHGVEVYGDVTVTQQSLFE